MRGWAAASQRMREGTGALPLGGRPTPFGSSPEEKQPFPRSTRLRGWSSLAGLGSSVLSFRGRGTRGPSGGSGAGTQGSFSGSSRDPKSSLGLAGNTGPQSPAHDYYDY